VHEYLQQICRADQQIIVFFTKADKLNQKEVSALKKVHSHALMVSSANKKGIQLALETIFNSLFGVKRDTL
jgi:GTP-binding protein